MTTFVKTEVRASEVARGCERMSVLRALDAEPADPTGEEREWFARGHLFEHYVVSQLEAKHGKPNVIRQPEIHHPLGVGHSDALIVPERLLVEVKSANAGSLKTPSFENGVTQLKIGLRFRDDADQGALYMINPSTLKPADVFVVRLTDEDIEEIDETFARIQEAIEREQLPERVCAKPSNGRAYLCPFIVPCFDGWEQPEVEEIDEAEALTVTSELAAIKEQEKTHRAALAVLEEGRKDAQERLGGLVPVGDSVVGPFAVKRIHKSRGPAFSVKAYEAAGHSLEALAEFFYGGSEWDEYRIAKAVTPGDTDYGESPF